MVAAIVGEPRFAPLASVVQVYHAGVDLDALDAQHFGGFGRASRYRTRCVAPGAECVRRNHPEHREECERCDDDESLLHAADAIALPAALDHLEGGKEEGPPFGGPSAKTEVGVYSARRGRIGCAVVCGS